MEGGRGLRAFLEEQVNEPLAYDEQLVRRLVEKITVYEDRMRRNLSRDLR